jgi:NifB/MoaA-like Fe-S oxidoreductase
VFAADELYLQAGRPIPPAAAYEEFAVVEDGVGLVRRFEDEFRRLTRRPGRPRWRGARVVTVVTGELFAPILRRLLGRPRVPGLRTEVVAVRNEFFGPAITVSGLLTGQDIARALTGRALGDAVLVPRVALTETKGVFLDDVAPEDLSRHLGAPVVALEATARGFVDGLLGRTVPAA